MSMRIAAAISTHNRRDTALLALQSALEQTQKDMQAQRVTEIQQAVTDGKLTQEQADQIIQRMQQGGPGPMMGGPGMGGPGMGGPGRPEGGRGPGGPGGPQGGR